MRRTYAIALPLLAAAAAAACSVHLRGGSRESFPTVPLGEPSLELRNGLWFDGTTFRPMTRYTANGRLMDRRPEAVDSVIDLAGGYVVPAFGEAHNHNAVPSDTSIARRYVDAGIFYVKNPNNFARDREAAVGRFNTPTSIDVAFSNAGLTGPGGHPIDLVRRNVARGVWRPEDGEGAFYITLASLADLEEKWPRIVAVRPDFIKTYLLYSDEYARRLEDSTTIGWRGLDPALLPHIVRKAHDANLRVSTHVETAADFRAAVAAGVDEINHLPGFRPERNDPATGYANLDRYRLTESDARAAARRSIVVVTTVSELLEILDRVIREGGPQGEAAGRVRGLIVDNLRLLRDAGVRIAIGSDRYRTTSVPEVMALRATGVFSDTALLRMWSIDTPIAIFRGRNIGHLRAGYEASFLVLDGNPLGDFDAVRRIRMRVKLGVILR